MNNHPKVPVILHTDIGTDFDDTWALSMLLSQPWWDLKLILVDTGDVRYRAALAAKTLAAYGRNNVEIGLGKKTEVISPLAGWLDGHELEQYPGAVHEDGAGRLIEIVRNSPQAVSLISIGPLPAIAAALEVVPDIAGHIRFTGMFGCLKYGFDHKEGTLAEYNIVRDIPAAQKVFSTPWLDTRITPLDTCGCVRLRGENFQKVFQSKQPRLAPIRDGFPIWRKAMDEHGEVQESSILFDTVAVHLAHSTDFLTMEQLPLVVNDKGFTVVDPAGQTFSVATAWNDRTAYENFLAQELFR